MIYFHRLFHSCFYIQISLNACMNFILLPKRLVALSPLALAPVGGTAEVIASTAEVGT